MNQPDNLGQIDCKQLLKKTDRDLKCVSYALSNVISNGENHTVAHNKMPVTIEVIENTPIYVKVPA
jgi:hypothetical protein